MPSKDQVKTRPTIMRCRDEALCDAENGRDSRLIIPPTIVGLSSAHTGHEQIQAHSYRYEPITRTKET